MNEEENAPNESTLAASAAILTDTLLDDLDDWLKMSARVRVELHLRWIPLITKHLVDNHAASTDKPRSSSFKRPVICAWCGNRYRSIVPEDINARSTQGDACAAVVYQVTETTRSRVKDPGYSPHATPELRLGEWLVQGHYGSSNYDCSLFRFVQNPPTAAADPICDNCVGERICAGDLEQIEGQYPW